MTSAKMEPADAPKREGRVATRLAAIDALRGVATIAVLFSHLPFSTTTAPVTQGGVAVSALPPWVDTIFEHGAYGVHLFLIISGFCIHMAWARHPADATGVSFTQFWKRRLHRLYPPYFFALLLSIGGLYVLHTFVMGASGSIAAHLGYADGTQLAIDLVLLLLLAQNFNGAYQRIGNGPLWTLALEEQLYVLYFPFLWMRRHWTWTRTLVVVALATIVWRTVGLFAPTNAPLLFLGPSRWYEWVLGALAVEAHLGRVQLPRWCRSGKVGALLLVLAIAFVNGKRFGVPQRAVLTISDVIMGTALFTLVNAACEVRWAEAGTGAVGRFFAWVGTFSYSLYLTHQLVIVGAKHIAMRAGLGTAGVLATRFVLPIAGGWLFYVLVERRFLNASRRAAAGGAPERTNPARSGARYSS